jgi:hypothetical protein
LRSLSEYLTSLSYLHSGDVSLAPRLFAQGRIVEHFPMRLQKTEWWMRQQKADGGLPLEQTIGGTRLWKPHGEMYSEKVGGGMRLKEPDGGMHHEKAGGGVCHEKPDGGM